MSRLRVRLVLNEGGEGAPLGQIVDIGREVERFLRYLAEDSGIGVERREWLARRFENSSVRFDIEAPKAIADEEIERFNEKLSFVASYNGTQALPAGIRHRTVLAFAKSADALASHEKMSFGLYHPGEDNPYDYRHLSKLDAVDLQHRLASNMKFRTTIQGAIHNIGVEEHYFNLRERKTTRLIRCDFPSEIYEEVHAAAQIPNSLVYVRGMVTQRRVDHQVESMKAQHVRAAPAAPDVFNVLFGKFPNHTGSLTTQEFIDSQWEADD